MKRNLKVTINSHTHPSVGLKAPSQRPRLIVNLSISIKCPKGQTSKSLTKLYITTHSRAKKGIEMQTVVPVGKMPKKSISTR